LILLIKEYILQEITWKSEDKKKRYKIKEYRKRDHNGTSDKHFIVFVGGGGRQTEKEQIL
jgi:hypothetical protein